MSGLKGGQSSLPYIGSGSDGWDGLGLNSVAAKFWQGETNGSKHIHWASWEKLCEAKFWGGCRNKFNLALPAKLGCRIP